MLIRDTHKPSNSSHLFTIRVWGESVNQNTRLVRIQVKHVVSGANRTFLEWSQVIEFVEAQLLENGLDQLRKSE
jgi:hypothetical protein